jgi:hypothetical protein
MELLHLMAPNDSNGNPRRTWLLINDAAIVDGHREDYNGKPDRFKGYFAFQVFVSPTELRDLNRQLQAVLNEKAKG